MRIPITRPWFDADEENAVVEVLRSGWVGQGPKVAELEDRFADLIEAPYAVAVSSGTAALHLVALALGIGAGDEVIVPAFTWISTPNTAEYVGARPVFCDVRLETLNIDPDHLSNHISPATRAIISVHQFGRAADLDAIGRIAESHECLMIEDAACALGTRYGRRHVGVRGTAGIFSFHPRKSITSGEGGMIVTSDESLFRTLRRMRDIGADRDSQTADDTSRGVMADHHELGFNYRMTDLQAAVLIAQLKKLPTILEMRLEQARRYDRLIDGSELSRLIDRPLSGQDDLHAYQAYVVQLRLDEDRAGAEENVRTRREKLVASLAVDGVAVRPGTHAPHCTSYYRKKYGFVPEDYPNAWRAHCCSLALPIYPGLTELNQEEVCERLLARLIELT